MLLKIYFALQKVQSGGLPTPDANTATVKEIMAFAFAIAGALALLMITISGLRYILSDGDPQKANKAKNGIIVALVGLAIAIAGESIVFFVVSQVQR